jgi:DNA (cytosine-5)-methyltransferase 1
MARLNYIDLFSGAGGLSEGFIKSGFEPIVHVEMDAAACHTLKTRAVYHQLKQARKLDIYTSYLKDEITRTELYSKVRSELLDSVINLPIGAEHNDKIHRAITNHLGDREVDLIIGGPPCQAYSIVGRARDENGMKGDPRNYLYVQYGKYLEKYQPKLFIFENVIGLKSAKGGIYLQNMEKLFSKKGYKMHLFTVEANRFGVLQNRKRVIIIGWRDDFVPNLPDLEAVNIQNGFKVKSIFNDLPRIEAGGGKDKYLAYRRKTNYYLDYSGIRNGIDVLTQHISRPHTSQDKKIYRITVDKWNQKKERLDYNDLPERLKTHSNRTSFFDRFKVVAQDLPWSQTVVAHISKDGHYYIHPDVGQNRSITIREAARLQSFPDDYYFEGVKEGVNRTPAFRQIGNAVPPLMAKKIAEGMSKVFQGL